ncbi:hypothetical protein BDL97_02G178600 [Sphagnum fallax]|nr:hypothetical protein BDL97_02G178600 [Sphagnum fallax]
MRTGSGVSGFRVMIRPYVVVAFAFVSVVVDAARTKSGELECVQQPESYSNCNLPRTTTTTKSVVPAYFVFGDSLVDAGNNNYLPLAAHANFPPYGETFFRKPTGRFSDGRNVGDFIAQALRLPFASPYLKPHAVFNKGANFASAGSGLLDATNMGLDNPMSLQLEQYKNVTALLTMEMGEFAAKKLISASFFVIASGSNDLGTGYLQNPVHQAQYSATQYITMLLEAYQTDLQMLYGLGARKVVMIGVPVLGCSPSARIAVPSQLGQCLTAGNQLALGFNAGLKQLVDGFHTTLPDFKLVYANSYDPVSDMISNPRAYGLTNVTAACCGAGPLGAEVQCGRNVAANLTGVQQSLCSHPSKYLFWDLLHPSEHVVRLLFREFWNGNSSTTYPFNLKSLAH